MDKRNRRRILSSPSENLYEIGKLPPQAVELEEAVLGAVILEENAFHEVSDILIPEAFYKEQNVRICKAVHDLKNRGEKADILTVTQELKRTGELEMVGGAYYVSSLTNRVASSANIETHMRIVLQQYIKRDSIRAATALISHAFEDGSDAFEILDEYEKNIVELTKKLIVRKATTIKALHEQFLESNFNLKNAKGLLGVPTGFEDLDLITGGWQKSDLIILAARPGMGKTAFVIQTAAHAALCDKPTLVFSLEQSKLQLYKRIVSQLTEIPHDKIIKEGLDEYDLALMDRDLKKLKDSPLYIDDVGGQSIFDIKTKARKAKREQHIELIVIDYLQLVTVDNSKGGPGNREQEVSLISRSLKALAKELDIPIIALSQLSRQVEDRGKSADHIPKLSHLRDSGSIEQDADIVMFIHRPEYYNITHDSAGNSTAGQALIIIAKNRHGALENIGLKWRGECYLFRDLNAAYKVYINNTENIITDGPTL